MLVAHRFGHAAAAPAVHGTLKLLDDAGIEGEIAVREVRSGRVEVEPMWGRPESIREQFRRFNAQWTRSDEMARVVALVPDLLFGSKVLSMLGEAGHEVTVCPPRRTRRAPRPSSPTCSWST